ncbi:hypothetical protein GE107_09610 [Cohnella sp. CFH 77786]|nr:hypothetical protein [Cohnella sp. CFH 77786]
MIRSRFGVHETMELHEVTTFKTVSLTKSKTMQVLVTDPELKELMREEAELCSRQLRELDGLLSQALLRKEDHT